MANIPWERLDPEIVPLVKAMNATGCIKTKSSCIGHRDGKSASVIVDATDSWRWQRLLYDLLEFGQSAGARFTLSVCQRYHLLVEPGYGGPPRLFTDWELRVWAPVQEYVIAGVNEVAGFLQRWSLDQEESVGLRRS